MDESQVGDQIPQVELIQARIWLVRKRCKVDHSFSIRNREVVKGNTYANGFDYFIRHVFSASFDNEFVYGGYIRWVAEKMFDNSWTMDISARDHFKSTRFYAEVMYDIFTSEVDLESHYFSYMSSMSSYHIMKIKKMMSNNVFFLDVVDRSFNAMASIRVLNAYGATYSLVPQGLLTFKRGIHAERVYLDDPLKDPENKLSPTSIIKVNQVVKTEIFPMVKKGGKCRIVGTPQTNVDFFFDDNLAKKFKRDITPAILNEKKNIALFPEWKSYDELIEIRDIISEKSFNQEYMTKPSYSEDSYVSRKDLMMCVNDELENLNEYKGADDVFAGFDIGKHTHPAHFSVFRRNKDKDTGKWHYVQIVSKWFDKWDYQKQLDYLVEAIDTYSIDVLRYDNTRGEFEGFVEQGLVPRQMKPIHFGIKQNNAMAVSLSTAIIDKRVELINDQRQLDQILSVTSDLKAMETAEGHGDSFWSNAMALWEEKPKEYSIRTL